MITAFTVVGVTDCTSLAFLQYVAERDMQFSERKGEFYLGRRMREDGETLADRPLFYDARDLTTHAVCVGMTGSGKSGLGLVLLEEAALNGIPALVIDPKGDMTNLLLTFPNLLAADFRPWVDVDGARRRNLSLDEYADQVARSWREGLASWGIGGTRLSQLKQSARFVIYTPGSDAGHPVSILHSLQVPALDWDRDAETLRETISSTVSALLALLNIESDPVTGREHSLLSTIIEQAWRAGQDVDLAGLIVSVQRPPFERLGVLPLEAFYPEKDRTALVLALNGLLASPRFAAWQKGNPLQVDTLLYTPDGRPQVSIFSIAHLSDVERSFFVTLLLEQVRAWLRAQEGTTQLRAILYCDELYGLMPPHPANPPTKAPLLAVLKQARSQGLGVVLAAQNPVDLDYKGLSNAGTWFIGKLQTANDRQRVLEGLSGALTDAGTSLDRKTFDSMIARLAPRAFLLRRVYDDKPQLFQTRHTMCYLRGPLTRAQIRQLVSEDAGSAVGTRPVSTIAPPPEERPAAPLAVPAAVIPSEEGTPSSPAEPLPWAEFAKAPPMLPTGINQYFLPAQISLEWAIHQAEEQGRTIIYQDRQLVYRPGLMAQAAARIDDDRRNVHERIRVSRLLCVAEDDPFIAWDAEPIPLADVQVEDRPAQGARFAPLPPQLGNARRIKAMQNDFADHVYRETAIPLLYHPQFKLTARPDETESQFKRRCYRLIEEKRDAEIAKVEKSYQTQIDRLKVSIRREERELDRDEIEYEGRKREELISAGESVFRMFSRRRSSRVLSTASRKRRLTQQAKADVEESEETLDDLEQRIADLVQDMENEKSEIQDRWEGAAETLERTLQTVQVRPRKADIFVEAFGVAWVPYWEVIFEEEGIVQHLSLSAFESGPSA
jgi:hypothetical protein